jgi:hypothetical protein
VRNIWAGYITQMEETIKAYKTLPGKPHGKRILGRQKSRWRTALKLLLTFSYPYLDRM